jgi:hypothetical protein
MTSGSIYMKDQLKEYMFRGQELAEMSLLAFITGTYDAKEGTDMGSLDLEVEVGGPPPKGGGRPPNQRVSYRPEFNRTGRCRVLRTVGHETLPHFVGRWFPRDDSPKDRELYCAAILTLLKPWTDLSRLKNGEANFEVAFQHFLTAASKQTKNIVENIQYYYECYDGAKRRREDQSLIGQTPRTVDFEDEACHDDLTVDSLIFQSGQADITSEDIEAAYKARGTMRERLYAINTMNTAFDSGVFSDIKCHTTFFPVAERGTTADLETYRAWEKQLKAACSRQNYESKFILDSFIFCVSPARFLRRLAAIVAFFARSRV